MAIPMQRLGGRAFAHQNNSNNVEAEYDRLRDLARGEAGKRSSCMDRSHQAYNSGDGAEAKRLSDEGHAHAAKMDDYNRQASEYIFRENNSPGRVPEDTIDLHGQFVEEAEKILEARIRDAQSRGQNHLHVIVGKGNHSVNHVQKIKPRVEQICQQLGLQYATEANEGRMYINLQGGKVDGVPPLPPTQGGGYGAGGGYPGGGQQQSGGYQSGGGYQQHGGQQQQQQYQGSQNQGQNQNQNQNQNEELERLAKKFLPRIMRKLEGCCVVM